MPKIACVIFDVDGTLINTPELIFAAYDHVADKHGLPRRTRDEIMVHMGKSLREIFAGLYPNEDVDPLLATNSQFVLEHMHEAELYGGLLAVLEKLHQDGVKIAAITGGNHKVLDVLQHHDIQRYFTSVVHSERITKQKPDPEGVMLALSECGNIAPEQTVLVGDMRFDVLTGKNAKVRTTVGITHGFGTVKELQKAGADYIIDSFTQLPQVLATIENNGSQDS